MGIESSAVLVQVASEGQAVVWRTRGKRVVQVIPIRSGETGKIVRYLVQSGSPTRQKGRA